MKFEFERLFTARVIAGMVGVTILLLVLAFIWIQWTAPSPPQLSNLLAVVTVIPAPTPTAAPAASPTYDPYAPTPTSGPGKFNVGDYVQISGTEGQGLRIRSDPGLNGKQLFLGFDTEVYTIMDGPRDVDGYTWYQLTAINDQTRVGWAASNFLTKIPKP